MTRPTTTEARRRHVFGKVRPLSEPSALARLWAMRGDDYWPGLAAVVTLLASFWLAVVMLSPAASERPATPASADAAGGRGDGE